LGGNLETAFALPAIYSNACPPPSDSESADVTAYEDGGWFEYDPATGRWIIRGVKSVLIESSQVVSCKTGEFVIEADTTRINSNVILNGDVTHGGGAMTSNGVVADKHKHPGDSGGTTGGPF
ncbi:phage baseplate assembly protein V, partial [Klebsiella pneumoniae]